MKKAVLIFLSCFIAIYFSACCTTQQCCTAQTKQITPAPAAPIGKSSKSLPRIGSSSHDDCYITLYAVGRGAPPKDSEFSEVQKYLLAERAAISDGYRLLSEKLEGVFVDAYSKTSDYVVDYDRIHLATRAFLKGVEITSIKHKDNGVCQVEMKITIFRDLLCEYFPKPVVYNLKTCATQAVNCPTCQRVANQSNCCN